MTDPGSPRISRLIPRPAFRTAKWATATSLTLLALAALMIWAGFWRDAPNGYLAPLFLTILAVPGGILLLISWLLAIPRRDGTVPVERAVASAVFAAVPVAFGAIAFVIAVLSR